MEWHLHRVHILVMFSVLFTSPCEVYITIQNTHVLPRCGHSTATWLMKKALRETQTLHAGCSKAQPKIFAPPQTPSRGRKTAKILSAGDGHYLYLQTQFGQDRCTQFRVIVLTDPQSHTHTHTNKPTDRTDYNTLHRSQLACSVITSFGALYRTESILTWLLPQSALVDKKEKDARKSLPSAKERRAAKVDEHMGCLPAVQWSRY